MSETKLSYKDYVPVTIVSVLFISQIVIGIYVLSEVTQIVLVAYTGVALYVLSGILFGLLPVFEFRKHGRVSQGKSYIHTTTLVETGIYSVVRHPQYITFILWAIAGMLVFQHWIVVLIGIPIIPLTYIDIIKADHDSIETFGDAYKHYMKRVPRVNFLRGVIQYQQARREDAS
jgi:protein-S-isoprenylcysteine O-methyltransferase Ste14